jgi:hypothetical protein
LADVGVLGLGIALNGRMTAIGHSNSLYKPRWAVKAPLTIFLTLLISLVATTERARANSSCQAAIDDFLERNAVEAGLKVETFEVAYRFEGRTPEQILSAGGFRPNPLKPDGSLLDHVQPRSLGTNKFVSLTLEPNNFAILQDGFLTENARSRDFPDHESERVYMAQFEPTAMAALESKPDELQRRMFEILGREYDPVWFMKYKSEEFANLTDERKAEFNRLETEIDTLHRRHYMLRNGAVPPTVVEFIEYRMDDVRGIDTASVGIAHEREIVTDEVMVEKITGFRKVYLIFYGGWIGLPDASDPHYAMRLKMALTDAATAPKIVFGDWEKF